MSVTDVSKVKTAELLFFEDIGGVAASQVFIRNARQPATYSALTSSRCGME